MAGSYLNIFTFLLTTLFYYMALKPNLSYDTFNDKTKFSAYTKDSYIYLAVYIFLVILIQFMVNASIISSTCGGSITENIGSAGTFTFLPWILIFGVLVIILTIYPGFKSAFSDVIGYYYVSSSANKLLTELLIDQNIQSKLESDATMTVEKKEAMQSAADAIIKICGNTSILINQIVPMNFNEYWNVLKPLMKDQYQNDGPESIDMKSKLFELVSTRDDVGEALWYIYTGLLLTSIVQLKISTKGCVNNPQTMEKNYQQFVEQEQEAKAAQAQSTGTTYTITN